MPRLGQGQSLKTYRVSGWFGNLTGAGENVAPFIVKASTLVGAVGRGAREARKQITKGHRYNQATITVEVEKEHTHDTNTSQD